MTTNWSQLIGHSRIRDWFSTAIRRGRFTGSFLLVGSPGVGKLTVANLLAQTLLCQKSPELEMQPCGVCEGCVQVLAQTHPDVIRLSKPKDKSFIPLDLLIGRPEVRMQEGFCRDIRLKPFAGTRKIAILEDADFLNEEGANCLLKTLEEPPPNAVVLLIGTSEQKQLPTIRSRCQIIRFAPLNTDDASRLMREVHQVESTDEEVAAALEVSAGDMHVALRILSDTTDEFRGAFDSQLAAAAPDPVAISRIITKRVDEAGKDASKRRGAMRDVFSMAVQFYRRELRASAAADGVHPFTLNRLDRSVRALREVDRSANQSSLIECYASDIASGTTGDRGEIG
ncbi:ATP-binding protein [Stieleria marina]|uniref:DNA polymerase III subunit tau n=1 Tax=Stieleria marina TaxID=1930275 RepID=A0A517NQI0_9BACT|nr:DNA polymerase III subunit tau [Planctomycetes bacterium K23_9]